MSALATHPRRLLLLSGAALLLTLVIGTGVTYATFRSRVIRVGHSLLVGPAAHGDSWVDGGNTQVQVHTDPTGARTIHVRRFGLRGELIVAQGFWHRSGQKDGQLSAPTVAAWGTTGTSTPTAKSLGSFVLIQE